MKTYTEFREEVENLDEWIGPAIKLGLAGWAAHDAWKSHKAGNPLWKTALKAGSGLLPFGKTWKLGALATAGDVLTGDGKKGNTTTPGQKGNVTTPGQSGSTTTANKQTPVKMKFNFPRADIKTKGSVGNPATDAWNPKFTGGQDKKTLATNMRDRVRKDQQQDRDLAKQITNRRRQTASHRR